VAGDLAAWHGWLPSQLDGEDWIEVVIVYRQLLRQIAARPPQVT